VNIRISERQRYAANEARMSEARETADVAQQNSVSGRKLHKISDDPVAMVRALRNRSQLESLAQFRKTLDFSKGFLASTETALMSINDALIRVKELCIQQSNSSYGAPSRKAAAAEVRQLTEQVLALGNSTYGDRYIFSGFKTNQPPLADDGSYLGDDGLIYVQVDEESYRPINVCGRDLFEQTACVEESDGGELVARPLRLVEVLRKTYEALEDNSLEDLHKNMDYLDQSMDKVVDAVASLGARRNALDDVSIRSEYTEERLLAHNNALEAADPIQSTMDLKRAETALNHTLQASAKLLSPSLLNFLH